MEFHFAAIALGANDNLVSAITHIHRANLRIEVVAHVGEIDVIALLCHMLDDGVSTALIDIDATDPRLGFGFDAFKRVEILDRLHNAIVGRLDGRNGTVFIPSKFFDCGRTAEAAATDVLLIMIKEEATPLEVNDTAVVRKRSAVSLIHDDTFPLPRTRW